MPPWQRAFSTGRVPAIAFTFVPLVIRADIPPHYAQVLVTASADAAHPQFETGEEQVVATSDAIAVSTVPDIGAGGPQVVDTEVWVNDAPPTGGWHVLWRG